MKIVFCINGTNNFSKHFLTCWTNLFGECIRKGHDVLLTDTFEKNQLLSKLFMIGGKLTAEVSYKPFGGKVDYDVLFFLSNDSIFRPEQFFALLESPHHITGGMCTRDGKTYETTKSLSKEFLFKEGRYESYTLEEIEQWLETTYKEDKPDDKPDDKKEVTYLEVVDTSMDWLAVKKGVLETLTYPWFSIDTVTEINEDNSIFRTLLNENQSFCRNALKSGFKTYVDPRIKIGILTHMVL